MSKIFWGLVFEIQAQLKQTLSSSTALEKLLNI